MTILDLIDIKKRGEELSGQQISYIVSGFVSGAISDYQMSAFLMAVCLKGMSSRETAELTGAMLRSGDSIDLSRFGSLSVDKHSTGGVGDKTTLIIAPIVSSLGAILAKMSGRGLGHTGGTVDKLESIKGYKTTLSPEEFYAQVERTGIAVIGQTGNLVPADKKIYALRDATSTVESIPLIASSIMSKKLAAGAMNIVLDVKTGSGAFMKTLEESEALAREMVSIGKAYGRNMAALITDMNAPLGNAVGNSLEVIEAAEVLRGEKAGDLRDICTELSAQMLVLCFGWDEEYAKKRINDEIDSKRAFKQMKRWIAAQGGNEAWLENTALFPKAPITAEFKAEKSGYISCINAEKVGLASFVLGAGREKKDDIIDLSAGIVLRHKTGDYVEKGSTLAVMHTSCDTRLKRAEEYLASAFQIGEAKPQKCELIIKTIR